MDNYQPQQTDPNVIRVVPDQGAAPPLMAGQAPPPPPGAPGATGDVGQNAGVRMLIPVGRCPLAIIAGYLALLGLIPIVGGVLALAGLILAAVAHVRIRKDPNLHGMGRVIFAYVLGGISVVGHAILLAGILVKSLSS